MKNEKTQKLAETIALLIADSEKESGDMASLRAALEKINDRLDRIESQLSAADTNPQTHFAAAAFHPSQQRFSIAEIIADEIIAGLEKEKPCPYEPTGKACDHCAMCSSRGF